MSTALAMAPSPAPHDRPAYGAELPTSANTSPTAQRTAPTPFSAPSSVAPNAPASQQQRSGSGSPKGPPPPTAKSSPPSASRSAGGPPRIIVKKEPGSPELPTARHRPRKLDLSKNTISTTGNTPQTARPLTSRDGLGIQEVGLACLSPGFVTQDPVMKEQLQRSLSVREHQRQIIESRLQQQSAKGDGPESSRDNRDPFAAKTPGMSRRNKAPPGLSIVAPSHEQFANERVIQSAPLGHTFTGRHNPHPLTRHLTNQPSNLSSTSHIHHIPANQTNNRLPPIADVFGAGLSGHPDSRDHHMYTQQNHRGPLTSPGHPPPPPPPQMPTTSRPREFKSAEEAQAELAAGRPDLLPKLVHYGGPQPPTPPSPSGGAGGGGGSSSRYFAGSSTDASRSAATSKRRRADYEEGASPPLGNGRPAQRRGGPFGEGRDSPDTQRAKREEFLQLCARAWDLFHT